MSSFVPYSLKQKRRFHYARARKNSGASELQRGLSIGWIRRDKIARRNARRLKWRYMYRQKRYKYYS